MVLVFSYGSNSTAQLQARVENKTLKAIPARAPGWQRIFCRKTERWGGAAASMAPNKNAVTHGAVVDLTDRELSLLDKYEKGYSKNDIEVELFSDGQWTNKATAIVYISDNSAWLHPPSEQYLTAIHVMLREQFHIISPSNVLEIDVCGIISDKLETVYTWRYPGSNHLSLPALCVEVNANRTHKWIMPQTITDIQEELKGVNVHTTAQLAVWLMRRQNTTDQEYVLNVVDDEAAELFKQLLQLDF
jgi:hypothetical protein